MKGRICGRMEASYEHRGMEITEGTAGTAAEAVPRTGITKGDGSYSIISQRL